MQNQTRADAWTELLRNGVPFVGFSIFYAALVWIFVRILERPLVESLLWVGFMGILLELSLVAAAWIRSRREAGFLLLDCGPLPLRSFYVFCVALIIFNAGVSISEFGIDVLLAIWILLGAFNGFLAFDRIQIWEQGIWYSLKLMKWGRIQAYHWEGSELVLQVETFFSKILGPRRARLQIPDEHREGVDEILGRHVFSVDPSI